MRIWPRRAQADIDSTWVAMFSAMWPTTRSATGVNVRASESVQAGPELAGSKSPLADLIERCAVTAASQTPEGEKWP